MANWRRAVTGASLGFAIGVTLVLLFDSKTRENLQKEFHHQWENLRLRAREYQKRVERAIEEGKAASRSKQHELEKELSIKRIDEELPDYIV